jgi:NADH-quinone oxidoreductase subunit M
MTLWMLLLLPVLAAPTAWIVERRWPQGPRWVSAGVLTVDLILACAIAGHSSAVQTTPWLLETVAPWIPRWGISVHLGLDGLSLVLVILTALLGLVSVVASWTEIQARVGFFHFNLLLVLAGVMGVFLALDLFLFFLFWEVMLVPMYLLIALWGHEQRRYAANKFFLFTQAGSLLLLAAIIGLALLHGQQTGRPSFDYLDLKGTALTPQAAWWLMLGFFAGFAVKLPAFPFHPWLPDAHTEAPTGGSVILAGLLLKTGAYGLIRFTIPLFPYAAIEFAPFAIALGVAGILYGGILAFAQTDFKRLVAYSSISHLGFALVGIFAMTELALQGAVFQLIAHGLSTGALFMLAGALQERLQTRDMRSMGGLWEAMPRLAALALFFAVASLGLPGLANFVGEFLVLFGTYPSYAWAAVLAALGLVIAAAYSLALVQRSFFGPLSRNGTLRDLSLIGSGTLMVLAALQLGLGLYPRAILSITDASVRSAIPLPSAVAQTVEQEVPLARGLGEGQVR